MIRYFSGGNLIWCSNRVKQRCIYFPNFISWVVLAGIINSLLNYSTGTVNNILANIGLSRVEFLASEALFYPVLIISCIIKDAGWGTIIYLAAINGVNPELFEAAEIDGASRFKQIIHVMIPGMMPMISVMLILAVANFLSAGFDQVIVFQNNYNRDVSTILDTYIYDLGIKGPYKSDATAVGLMKSVISMILLFIADRTCKKMGQRGIV